MPDSKELKINLNEKEDVLMLFNEIKSEYPSFDELEILSAVASIAGLENPPKTKREGKKLVIQLLNANP